MYVYIYALSTDDRFLRRDEVENKKMERKIDRYRVRFAMRLGPLLTPFFFQSMCFKGA